MIVKNKLSLLNGRNTIRYWIYDTRFVVFKDLKVRVSLRISQDLKLLRQHFLWNFSICLLCETEAEDLQRDRVNSSVG